MADGPLLMSLDNVCTKFVDTPQLMVQTLQWITNLIVTSTTKEKTFKVIIIDSFASVFKNHFPATRTRRIEWSKMTNSTIYALFKLVKEHEVAVVIKNEIVDVFPEDKFQECCFYTS